VRGPPRIILEEAEFFRALASDSLERVRDLVLEKRFERRKVLFFAGEPADYLWVVRDGEVRLYKSSRGGRHATLETLRPGQAFGALSALDDDRYPVSAEAMSEGVAWCLRRSAMLSMLREEPQLGVEVVRIMSGRLHGAHERLRSFAHDPAPARLAAALLGATRQGEAQVTRRALAETAGTTVETAIRVLRRFERDGVIHSEVGHVVVLDDSALQRIAGNGES
jgi:CRP-like cAMP-binding protein